MSRRPIPTWFFAMVVVRRGDEYLLVHERGHGQTWYLPGGRVEPGERIVDAAVRETLEEAGVRAAIQGILRVEHSPHPSGTARCRVFFLARPDGDPTPKSEPDEHSLGARWVKLEELAGLSLRGEEAREILNAVAAGAPSYPLSVLTYEGAAWAPRR
ncbi:NUDIX hydrolase [Polyangium mundeleinium]|uniref:NUDIX hydrolase n=1 Tax=Polyangium mundeleinium TaxID=2995306 RepID=A0ABT5F0U1_9BACT|nr:NUDIX hydrolase [Polyangium mundeleinium]MDC0747692.1 NUDIX hydrolase [Polyangium mundeleinium]